MANDRFPAAAAMLFNAIMDVKARVEPTASFVLTNVEEHPVATIYLDMPVFVALKASIDFSTVTLTEKDRNSFLYNGIRFRGRLRRDK